MQADLDAAHAAGSRDALTLQSVANAWNQSTGDALGPRNVVPIRPKRWWEPGHHQYVFKLERLGCAPETSAVAMLCASERVEYERVVYEDLLSQSSASCLEYFGWLPHATPALAWQFIEFVEPRSFRRQDPSHAEALASWLGRLHAVSREVASLPTLPDRGVDFHRAELATAGTELRAAAENREYLNPAERERIALIVSALDDVEARWRRYESLMRRLPHGFIHGDLKPDNVGFTSHPEPRVVAYDWEYAGWGPLAVDVGTTRVHRDVASHYVRTLQTGWPDLRVTDVEYMGSVGEILRAVMVIRWLVDDIPLKAADEVLRGIEAQLTIMRARLEDLSW